MSRSRATQLQNLRNENVVESKKIVVESIKRPPLRMRACQNLEQSSTFDARAFSASARVFLRKASL